MIHSRCILALPAGKFAPPLRAIPTVSNPFQHVKNSQNNLVKWFKYFNCMQDHERIQVGDSACMTPKEKRKEEKNQERERIRVEKERGNEKATKKEEDRRKENNNNSNIRKPKKSRNKQKQEWACSNKNNV